MKILLLNQFFWPDGAPTSLLLTDLARYLADEGHEVTVICGRSSYFEDGSTQAPRVTIRRIPNLEFAHGKVARLLSYSSFFAFAIWHSLRVHRPDVVVTLTTPPMLSLVGTILKKIKRVSHYCWEMDLYPEVAVDLNVLQPSSWLTRALSAISGHVRCQADGVIALGTCMQQRLARTGHSSRNVFVAENWADGASLSPMPLVNDGRFTVLYSGNLGLAHDVDTIAAVMDRLKEDGRFHFSFVGSGPRREYLKQYCHSRKIQNVSFRPHCSWDELACNLGTASIGLVTQQEHCLGSVVPSKIYGLMAARRPTLFIGPRKATPSQIVQRFQCGWQVDCGDSENLVRLLKMLAMNPDLVRQAGVRARQAFLTHYDLPIGVARIGRILGVTSVAEKREVAVGAGRS